MTIHDELVLKLIEADKWGKATGYVIKIVGSGDIDYSLEELYYWRGHFQRIMNTFVEMSPDIVVTNIKSRKRTAIELEGDTNWDFAESLRQIRKYRMNSSFQDVVVIIPKRYERFAILYAKQGFRVYLWKATRIWQCLGCGQTLEGESRARPKPSCSCKTELEFEGVTDVEFSQFEYAIDKMVG